MNRPFLAQVFWLGVLGTGVVPDAAAQDSLTDVHCGKLLDVENKKVLDDQHILIRNHEIVAVGASASAKNAKLIDLSAETCAPGFMDMHVHLLIEASQGTSDAVVPTQSSSYKTLMGLRHAQALLNQGFTTLRVLGDRDYYYATIELRNAFGRGEFVGPRMLVAPHWISPLGGHGDFNTYSPDLPNKVFGQMIADGDDEIRKAVRQEIKYGADWIKVTVSGGIMSQGDDPDVAGYSDEELRVFVEETHRNGKKIAAHAHGDRAVRAAINAGFDSIEHGTMMTEDTAKMMASKGIFLVPTLYSIRWIAEQGESSGISRNSLEKAQMIVQQQSQAVKFAYRHGVKMALGTDPIFPIEQAIREFQAMGDVIQDNWYVLQAATIRAAELLGLERKIGSLKPGKRADIVAMPGNPLDNIAQTANVNFVMQDGIVVRQSK